MKKVLTLTDGFKYINKSSNHPGEWTDTSVEFNTIVMCHTGPHHLSIDYALTLTPDQQEAIADEVLKIEGVTRNVEVYEHNMTATYGRAFNSMNIAHTIVKIIERLAT